MDSHAGILEPIAALLTAGGRGAVATIQLIAAPDILDNEERPLFRAANGRPIRNQPIHRIVFGRWGEAVPENVVLCRIDECTIEIHCHGGLAASRRILDELSQAGVAVVTGRELVSQTQGPFAAECQLALSRTRTQRTAEILLEQCSGLFKSAIRSIAIDPVAAESRLALKSLLRWAEFGLHLTQPWRVAIAGRPNVGKSSLINALAGYTRSIVYDEPGTTRDVVTVDVALNGWPFELLDTAGIRQTEESLESAGIVRAREMLATANCRVLLFDVSQPLTDDDRELLRTVDSPILVAHKCDLPAAWTIDGMHPVSSLTGFGTETLMTRIVDTVVPQIPAPGTAVPFTERQAALLQRTNEAVATNDALTARHCLLKLLGDLPESPAG